MSIVRIFIRKILLYQTICLLSLTTLFMVLSSLLFPHITHEIKRIIGNSSYVMWNIMFIVFPLIALSLSYLILHMETKKNNANTKIYFEKNNAYYPNKVTRSLLHFQKLYLQRNEFVSILNSIQEGLLVISHKGNILYYNQSFHKHFSHTEKIRGTAYYDVILDKNLTEFIASIPHSHHTQINKEILIHQKTYQLSTSIINDKTIYIIVFHDISQTKTLEKIKRDFIANASHELRTPLTSIKGYIELLDNSHQKSYIDIITRNTDRIINIINDLLKLSELEQHNISLNYEPCNLYRIIKDILVLFTHKANAKNITINTSFEDSASELLGDKLKIEEICTNLIDNAIKYTDANGTITLSSLTDATHITIIIKDTGIGVPQKYRDRIFERFFVVDKARSRKTGGTGLGLAIVKHIIQQHHGTLRVDSEVGKGSTFSVILPRTPQKT